MAGSRIRSLTQVRSAAYQPVYTPTWPTVSVLLLRAASAIWTILTSAGASYSVSRTVLDSAGASYSVPATVLSSTGASYTPI